MCAWRRFVGCGLLLGMLPLAASAGSPGFTLTTTLGGPPSREQLEGRVETKTKLVFPQVGCWHAWSGGLFLGLELGWSVASSAPSRPDTGPREGGFAGLARPIASIVHLGWAR